MEVCHKQLEAVEAVGVPQAPAAPPADCVEMGGLSFEINGVDVRNRYAVLDEERTAQKQNWEYYRTYYENRSAPPPTIQMHNILIKATRKAVWKLATKNNCVTGNTSLNFEFEEFPDGNGINFDPEYPSLNCEFETVIRRGRNKPVMGSGLVGPVKGKPVIGEPVTGSGIANKRLRAEYKKAATAAVSTSVSTRLNSLSCDCSDLN